MVAVNGRLDCEAAGRVFDEVWGLQAMVPNEVIIATVHAGGYASLAWWDDQIVGASWGFLGAHHGEMILHSHVTGVLPLHGSHGVGEALKRHQWSWAAENAVSAITWTFDPLVRRNAYFNLVKLGATVVEYHEDFYGTINDGLNRGEHTDRLIVRWPVAGQSSAPRGYHATDADWKIPTPDDIESLRRSDHKAAKQWREQQRADLRRVFNGGGAIIGVMVDGAYAVVDA